MRALKQIWIVVTILTVFSMTSCVDDELDVPPITKPVIVFDTTTVISIADFKALYTGSLLLIDTNWIIRGKIVANDESGNFYKTMEMQDETGAIELKMDQTSLYNDFRVGQRVYIKCKDLYLGNYKGMMQLGYIYNGDVGRIPAIMIPEHFFCDSFAGAVPAPKKINLAALSTNDLSKLCVMENVTFVTPNVEYATLESSATDRYVMDEAGNQITVRSSQYANFAASLTPEGPCNITGILSIYNSTWQFYIRDLNDVKVIQIIHSSTFDTDPATSWGKENIAGNKNWTWNSSETCMDVIYSTDVAGEDWLISPALDLTNVSNPMLTFKTWTRFTDSGNSTPMIVKISTNYSSGAPSTATWTDLSPSLPAANTMAWTSSGEIDLNAYKNQTVHIAFQYKSSGTTYTTGTQWKIDDFIIKDN